MSGPSVLFINRVYPPVKGATGRVLRDLAHNFARAGWNVHVLTTGEQAQHEQDGDIKITRVKGMQKPKSALGYMWVWLKTLNAALRSQDVDLVVTLSDPPMISVVGSILQRFKNCAHIHWCHDLYPDLLPAIDVNLLAMIQKVLVRISRRSMRKADKNVVIGRCMASYLSANGIEASNMSMIPNWYNLELQHGQQESASVETYASIASRLGPDGLKSFDEQHKGDAKFRVLYAGNLGRAHAVDTILDAAAILQSDHPEIEFVFVGDGPGFEDLAHIRSKRGLGNIRFLPFQPDSRLRAVMESGDLHLITLRDEAQGLAVPCKFYSALAVERPCVFVGPQESEIAQVIEEYKAGTVVPNGRAEDLAARIKHYRLNGEEWFRAHEGAKDAGQTYLPKSSIDAWIERANDIIQNRYTSFDMVNDNTISTTEKAVNQ
jgi:glycosyltransferase involved in cell wall biosynthesis